MDDFHAQCLPVRHAGEQFLLHPQRVMYWPAKRILFTADVHAGKEHVFARHGIAIPGGISESTLVKLFALVRQSGANRLIVLGDFMHDTPVNSESWLRVLTRLLNDHPSLVVEIIAGNHDRSTGQRVTDSRLMWHAKPLLLGPLALHHEPCRDERGYVLCGHIHPAWRLRSRRRNGVRSPVFWFREHCAVLPAFGEFTGGMLIDPDKHRDSIYMTGPDCVIKVPVRATLGQMR